MRIERDAARAAFAESAGFDGDALVPLAGDASARRYFRAARRSDGAPAMLMDAPPETNEPITAFLAIGRWLNDAGFSAPETFEADVESGFALIEDLGDGVYAHLCDATPAIEAKIYAAATDILAALAAQRPPEVLEWNGLEHPLSPYDAAVFRREAELVLDWWVPAAAGAEVSADYRAEFLALIDQCADLAAGSPPVVTLRDYHAENLLWLPERPGMRAVGLLDYQDALSGVAAYDLVSLLEDARRDTSQALRNAMCDRFLDASGIRDRAGFAAAYAALGAQRNLKILGIFARLKARDGKAGYLSMTPRVWGHLQRDLAHPALTPLKAFIDARIPAPTAERLARALA